MTGKISAGIWFSRCLVTDKSMWDTRSGVSPHAARAFRVLRRPTPVHQVLRVGDAEAPPADLLVRQLARDLPSTTAPQGRALTHARACTRPIVRCIEAFTCESTSWISGGRCRHHLHKPFQPKEAKKRVDVVANLPGRHVEGREKPRVIFP